MRVFLTDFNKKEVYLFIFILFIRPTNNWLHWHKDMRNIQYAYRLVQGFLNFKDNGTLTKYLLFYGTPYQMITNQHWNLYKNIFF